MFKYPRIYVQVLQRTLLLFTFLHASSSGFGQLPSVELKEIADLERLPLRGFYASAPSYYFVQGQNLLEIGINSRSIQTKQNAPFFKIAKTIIAVDTSSALAHMGNNSLSQYTFASKETAIIHPSIDDYSFDEYLSLTYYLANDNLYTYKDHKDSIPLQKGVKLKELLYTKEKALVALTTDSKIISINNKGEWESYGHIPATPKGIRILTSNHKHAIWGYQMDQGKGKLFRWKDNQWNELIMPEGLLKNFWAISANSSPNGDLLLAGNRGICFIDPKFHTPPSVLLKGQSVSCIAPFNQSDWLITTKTGKVYTLSLPAKEVLASIDGINIHPEESFIVESFEFKPNATTLVSGYEAALTTLVKILKEHPTWKLQIIGHTDQPSKGYDESDMESLSLKRAIRVKKAFIDRGIPAQRISSQGKGSKSPIFAGNNPKNRRVEMRFILETTPKRSDLK